MTSPSCFPLALILVCAFGKSLLKAETPGVAVFYNNGKEIFRWENARVSDAPSCLRYDLVTGGTNNSQVVDAKLPADFTLDYVRAWQRKDLASSADGPKPNQGDPDETKNSFSKPQPISSL